MDKMVGGFGRLIKTFLPGSILFMALVFFFDSVCLVFSGKNLVLATAWTNALMTSAIAFPVSLILGIFSNTVFFTWFSDILVKRPYARSESGAQVLGLLEKINQVCMERLRNKRKVPIKTLNDFEPYLDPIYLLLPKLSVEKIVFLQESYWYYLEFQLNISFALTIFALSATSWLTCMCALDRMAPSFACAIAAVQLVGTLIMVRSFVQSARKNYDRHRKKLCNLCIGALSWD